MAFYVDEEEVWKCPKHPSKRRRNGICPICLRDRLLTLCPDCANVRPCACPIATTSSSSSSSSTFSFLSSASRRGGAGVGDVGRVSNLIDSEPSFRRSRSLAIPFLRSSRHVVDKDSDDQNPTPPVSRSRSSFWSMFKTQKTKKGEEEEGGEEEDGVVEMKRAEEAKRRMMMRSRSVGIPVLSDSGRGDVRSSSKLRGWHFPSPMKAFRQSKMSKVVQERSPLYRG